MSGPRFKVAYVPWYRPVRLAMRNKDGTPGFDFVGWVWRQKAFLVNNLNHGWVAFVDDQTEENLKRCPCCKRYLAGPANLHDSAPDKPR